MATMVPEMQDPFFTLARVHDGTFTRPFMDEFSVGNSEGLHRVACKGDGAPIGKVIFYHQSPLIISELETVCR